MIKASLREVGTARSIVIDEGGVVLAGNGVRKGALEVGNIKLRVIDAEPDELIAVRRKGLTKQQKAKLALYDNRTGELAEWDWDQVQKYGAGGLKLKQFFSDQELAANVGKTVKFGKTDPDDT